MQVYTTSVLWGEVTVVRRAGAGGLLHPASTLGWVAAPDSAALALTSGSGCNPSSHVKPQRHGRWWANSLLPTSMVAPRCGWRKLRAAP